MIFNKITAWLQFLSVVIHLFVPSRYDYVEIHDGSSESADLLGKHCSNIAPAPIISSGPSLHIKFVSDYAHQGAGFSLRYEIFKTGNWRLLLPLYYAVPVFRCFFFNKDIKIFLSILVEPFQGFITRTEPLAFGKKAIINLEIGLKSI